MIHDNELNIKEFKEFFPELDWIKVPRKLSEEVSDYFYVGTYETEDRRVHVSVRPSMRMQITDTNKKCTKNGDEPLESYNGRFYQYSSSVEVLVESSLISKIEEVAKELPKQKNQTVSWE